MIVEFLEVAIGQIPLFYQQTLFLFALIGAGIGGYIDLKTTEIPDLVPISMAAVGLIIHGYLAYSLSSINYMIWPVAVALGFLLFGYALYYAGQWGEADVLLLAAVGFLVPYPFLFFAANTLQFAWPFLYLVNTFIVGGAYSLIYAGILSYNTKGFTKRYFDDVKSHTKELKKIIAASAFGFLVLLLIIFRIFSVSAVRAKEMIETQILVFVLFVIVIFFFYRFAFVVDNFCFRKKVRVDDLKEGDVLAEDMVIGKAKYSSKLFIGLEKTDIEKIIKANPKKQVWIKEGIRYGPTFFITLVTMWLFGDVLFLIMGIM
ncbi:MAG: prepilin peptidase [Candidatus Aenigmarchaeota archaeon]|nr:prepilin peptidase [Candidatus Aenigmarchaeota archaeon]